MRPGISFLYILPVWFDLFRQLRLYYSFQTRPPAVGAYGLCQRGARFGMRGCSAGFERGYANLYFLTYYPKFTGHLRHSLGLQPLGRSLSHSTGTIEARHMSSVWSDSSIAIEAGPLTSRMLVGGPVRL